MNTHTCPVPGGTADVSRDMLMCSRHWYSVPKPLRTALWHAWRNGLGVGTIAHYEAMRACIHAADSSLTCSGRHAVHG